MFYSIITCELAGVLGRAGVRRSWRVPRLAVEVGLKRGGRLQFLRRQSAATEERFWPWHGKTFFWQPISRAAISPGHGPRRWTSPSEVSWPARRMKWSRIPPRGPASSSSSPPLSPSPPLPPRKRNSSSPWHRRTSPTSGDTRPGEGGPPSLLSRPPPRSCMQMEEKFNFQFDRGPPPACPFLSLPPSSIETDFFSSPDVFPRQFQLCVFFLFSSYESPFALLLSLFFPFSLAATQFLDASV